MSGGKNQREQKREDREEFGRGGSATCYKMKERMFSIGDDDVLILAATVAVDQLCHDIN